MKRFTRLSIIAAASLICGSVFLCSKHENNNPVTSSYEGNYVLDVRWDSLSAPDSIQMLKTYEVSCSTGVDKFDTIVPVDTQLLDMVSVTYSPSPSTIAHLKMVFKKVFSGKIYVAGIRPNNKEVFDSTLVKVLNVYRPILKNLPSVLTLGRGINFINIDVSDSSGGVNKLFWKLIHAQTTDSIAGVSQGTNRIAVNIPDVLFSDSLLIWATDNRYTSDTTGISIVIQGYAPGFDSISLPRVFHCGDTLKCPVFLSNVPASQFSVVILKDIKSSSDTIPYSDNSSLCQYAKQVDIKMNKPIIDTGKVVLKTYLLDSSGRKSDTQTDTIIVLYKLPALKFSVSKDSVFVSNKDSVDIQVTDTNSSAAKYSWTISMQGGDTTFLSDNNRVKLFPVSSPMTIRVVGINVFGFHGDTAKQTLLPKDFQYTLLPVTGAFPDVVTARHPATWTVALDSTATLANHNGSYYWQIIAGAKTTQVNGPTMTSWTGTFNDSMPLQIKVIARDASGDSSGEVSSFVTIRQYKPVFQMLKDSVSTPILTPITIKAHVFDVNPDNTGKIDTVFWDKNNDGKADTTNTDSSITMSFPYAGVYKISGWAKDNDGFLSETSSTYVIVKADYPYFIAKNDTTVYVNVLNTFSVTAMPGASGAAILKYYWRVLEDSKFDSTTSPTFSYKFTKPGIDTVITTCADSRGAQSAKPDTFLVTVNQGLPIISSAILDSNESRLFVNDTFDLRINASDPNGSVTKIFVNWDSTQNASIDSFTVINTDKLDSLMSPSHVYVSSAFGPKTIAVWAIDNDGYKSLVFSKHVTVRLGKPVVSGISVDTVPTWIKSKRRYTIAAHDTNGTIASYYVSWNTGEAFKLLSSNFKDTSFVTAETRSIKAYVLDNSGIQSDTFSWSLVVHQGKPKIDSVKVDAVGNTIFVKDTRTFTVYASDSNGTIKRIYAAWNNGTSPDDSVDVNFKSGSGTIQHMYDTSFWGPRTVRFWVRDNDTLMSSSKDTAITVRLAPPVLWGDNATKDTIWTIINNGPGNLYPVHINHFDTNGTIVNYYWNEAGATLGRMTTADTIMRNFSQAEMQYSLPIWIYGRDNDSLTRGGKFIMFADSVPPAPSVTFTINSTGGVINWRGKDTKDQNQTKYEILVRKATIDPTEPGDVISQYKAGTGYASATIGGFDFSYNFATQGPGEYHCQVIAKDARGSISKSIVVISAY